METVFPTDEGFAGFFLVGFRKDPDPPGHTQRVGAVILKRTYDIHSADENPPNGTLTPATEPLPVFVQDQPDMLEQTGNLVVNGDFETVYDDVNVFSMVRYEHDLAPYKPDGDIIVLDFVDVSGQCSVKVDGQEWLRRTLGSNEFEAFGWASRSKDGSERASEAGTFSDDPNAYPPEWPVSNPLKDPLPPDFNNRFYNGYHREARDNAGSSKLPHLTAAVPILIQRPGTGNNYGFRLGNEIVSARYYYYTGTGPDEERRWQSKDIDEIYFDTLVIEPDQNRCYAVWRGVWDFDERSEDTYRRLVVSVGEA